jgi:lambda family phage portal protein
MSDKRRGLFGRMFGRESSAPVVRAEPPVTLAPAGLPRHAVRRFKAAKPGRNVGGFGGIMADSPRAEARQDLRGLVNHARYAAQNVDYLKSYEMMVRRHVVGPAGIALQMDARLSDGARDRALNDTIEKAWRKWGRRGNCTVCGKLSWWHVEKTAATMLAREGNFFLRMWRGRAFGRFGFQVQLISVDLLDVDMVADLGGGRYVDGGVEFDALNRPVAYHFFDGHPAESHTGRLRTRLRVPADQIVHTVRQSETGQNLGVPESHTALRRFNLLGQYEEAAMTAAHYGAAAMVFLENTDPEGVPSAAPGADGDELPEEMEAGMIVDLPPGYKATANPSNYPDANMPGFLKSLIRGGAAGLGVSYAGLSSDMEGSNFSSLKDGRGEERDEWRMFQRDLWEGLHGEVFRHWLQAAYLSGQLPGVTLDDLDRAADAATWRGRGWISPNPKDDATANDMNLKNRLIAPSDVVSERGGDFEQTVSRFANDLDTLRAAGVPLASSMMLPETQGPAPSPPPEVPGLPGGEPDPGEASEPAG